MRRKTSSYTILISLILLFVSVCTLHAQNPATNNNRNSSQQQQQQQKKKKEKEKAVYFPLYNGVTVGADLYGLGARALGGDFLSSEVSVDVSLKNRFFPVLEAGYGTTDTWSETGTHYQSSAPYFRIGMNYNTMYKKGNPNFLYLGVRYGITSFSYDVNSMPVTDPIFGGEIDNPALIDEYWGGSIPYHHPGLKASMQWFEFLLGVRAKIYKDFYMGWSLRLKYRMSASTSEYGDPWYVPGYGTYKSSQMGVTYSIIYKLPF